MNPDGETPVNDFDRGFFVGLLVGEGHFGGDGKQPHITLRMHTDHEELFRWLERTFPGARLYGPYHHGGRSYYQWMARGTYLKQVLVPLLDASLRRWHSEKVYERYLDMKRRYRIDTVAAASPSPGPHDTDGLDHLQGPRSTDDPGSGQAPDASSWPTVRRTDGPAHQSDGPIAAPGDASDGL